MSSKPMPAGPPAVTRMPVLQRDSWAASFARTVVLFLALLCMVAFAVALARVTLVPSPASTELIHTNLEPGSSIRAYLDQPDRFATLQQIGGNVLLGVPFGVLLPMLFPRIRGLLRVPAFTALVMVMVETAQGLIVEGRAFDVDDVILNTSGALVGYLLVGRWLGRALHPRRHHWWHRWTRDRTDDLPEAAPAPAAEDRPVPEGAERSGSATATAATAAAATAAAAKGAAAKGAAAKGAASKAAVPKAAADKAAADKPTAGKRTAKKAAGKTATKRSAAKKTATKKTAAKKAATKKAATKKAAAKKAVGGKAAAEKSAPRKPDVRRDGADGDGAARRGSGGGES
ncbi:VanZ family protein [Streptomyces hainanensis]|uniref:VanZ family protein n=1 Tax=Streptomyces hainanensis TaxID=402648 RepID=UPI001A9F4D18